MSTASTVEAEIPKKQSMWDKYMGPQADQASPSFRNRWAMVAPAFLTHMCIGSPYAWSVMSGPCSRDLGFVASAADDWSFSEATMPMSIVFILQGLSAAMAGKWQTKVGSRTVLVTAAGCFGGGLMLGSVGIATHNLPLLYLGYGVMAGTGVGIGYTPPVQSLIQWFPDRKGIASGMTIAGFGSGALLFAPMSGYLMDKFKKFPDYVGALDKVEVTNEAGRLFAQYEGKATEVVMANATDLANLPYSGLAEGYYAVGTGDTGASTALAVMGSGYLAIMLGSAFTIRRPAPGYVPDGYTPPAIGSAAAGPAGNVHFDNVLKTPQYYMLATTFFCVATGGMGIFSVAKPMMTQVFSGALPGLVTVSFATSYLLAVSAGNLGGRLGWAAFSDKFGRRTSFNIFTLGSIPLYLAVPFLVDQVIITESAVPLAAFCGTTVAAITMMGGTYAILPAYEADLFGAKYVGAIHGRMLLASTAAALAGPTLILTLRSASEKSALMDLLSKVDPAKFQETFGLPVEQAQELINAKTLTISKLLDILPADTLDPSPYLYNSTMYSMAGLMAVASISHRMLKPVDPKYFEKPEGVVVDAESTEKKMDAEAQVQSEIKKE